MMKNQINIAEILKDCPKGTKLYSPLCGECYFDRLNMGTIICKKQNTQEITFTSGGYYMLPVFDDCECQLFPSKDQRDWSKFQQPFKDGDIISNGHYVAIFHKIGKPENCVSSNVVYYHCWYNNKYTYSNFKAKIDFGIGIIEEYRYATEKEKQKLFQAIKDNGYKWNPETKTLEKLTEFKDGDVAISALGDIHLLRTKDSSYCAYRTRWTGLSKLDNTITTSVKVVRLATEAERQILFDSIKANGYKWNEETKTLEKLINKNKFVIGAVVTNGKIKGKICLRDGDSYVLEDNEQLHKVLSKHLSKAQADAIINEGAWFSKDGCTSYYVKSIDDWSI